MIHSTKKITSNNSNVAVYNRHLILLFFLLLGPVFPLLAQEQIDVNDYRSMAPTSIPIPETGSVDVAMTFFRFNTHDIADTNSIDSITLSLLQDGSFIESAIQDVKVFFDPGANVWDGTETRIDDVGTTSTFSSGTVTIDLDESATFDESGWNCIYIVFQLASSADVTDNIGCNIDSIIYGLYDPGPPASFTESADSPFDSLSHTTTNPVDNYKVSLQATGIAPTSAEQTTQKVPVMKLEFDLAAIGETSATAYIDSLEFRRVGGVDGDFATGGISIYDDSGVGSPNSFDTDDLEIAADTLVSGVVVLTPTTDLQITSSGATFWVAVNVSASAGVGNVIGLDIENPQVKIVFSDPYDDNNIGSLDYADTTIEYDQAGYILDDVATPSTGNTFTVEEYIPFIVTQFTPAAGATEVVRETDVTAVFGKDVDDTTLAGNFTLVGAVSGAVSAAITYDAGQKKATLNPDANLNWEETYTATVNTNVLDSEANPLEAQQQWSFKVEPAVPPTVSSTVPDEGATNVVRDIQVKATFSEDVFDVDGTSFTLYQGATPIAGDVTYAGLIATFTPSTPLAYNTQYTATITTAVYDDDDLYLQTDKVWNFWTLAATPPAVLSVFPANGTTKVPIASTVQAVFSKPIDDTTLTGYFTVEDSLGTPISGAITYDDDSFTATFTPAAPFSYLKTYTATITTGVTDIEGTALNAGKTWDFTTFGFDKATIVNNRIVSGGNSETLIFVPVPPNTSDKVSVQVFTTTGKLVRSFYRNATYSSIESQLPIRWDGTNDRGSALGPGMYFVQIVVAGNKQTLKVMIVR